MAFETATQPCPHSRRLLAAVVIAASVIAWSAPGLAETSAVEKEAARGMMEKGDEAYEAGRYSDALEAYRQAHSIMGVPTTGLAVALALEKSGRLREAREVALAVARSRPVVGEPNVLADARVRADALARQLETAIPTLHVMIGQASECGPVSVAIDGIVVPAGPVPLDPGEHRYSVTAQGCHPLQGKVSLERNERRRIEHVLALTTKTPSRPSSTPALVYVGFGVGAVGALVGTATGIVSLSRASSAKAQCEGTSCWPEARSDADSARRYATVSNVSFGVGLVGVAVGLISLLSSPTQSPAKQETVRLEVRPVHAGASIGLVREF